VVSEAEMMRALDIIEAAIGAEERAASVVS
jgi:hypothetical protein